MKYILYQFKNDLNSDSLIKKYKTTGGYKIGIEYSKLLITDYKMRDDLSWLDGILQNYDI